MEKIRLNREITLDHRFFDHIKNDEYIEIVREIRDGKTHLISFYSGDREFMAAAITLTNKGIHLREMGGSFIWGMRYVEIYCQILAEVLTRKYITFRSKLEVVKAIGVRLGFEPIYVHDDNSVEYEKELKSGRQQFG